LKPRGAYAMDSMSPFRSRIDGLIASRIAEREEESRELEADMAELIQRQAKFTAVAQRLFHNIVRPRLQLLEEVFDDARYDPGACECLGIVTLNCDGRFGAAVTAEIGIDSDSQAENALISYRMRIIPIFMKFDREAAVVLPLAEATDEQVRTFVEERVAACAETYLRLKEHPQYQRGVRVTDPVCGMTIRRTAAAASLQHNGDIYSFCSQTCSRRFAEDPARFVAVRGDVK